MHQSHPVPNPQSPSSLIQRFSRGQVLAERCQDLGSGSKTWDFSGQRKANTWVSRGSTEPRSWVSLSRVRVAIMMIRCFSFNEGNSLTNFKFGTQIHVFCKKIICRGNSWTTPQALGPLWAEKIQVLDPFCNEKFQVLCLACQEVTESWLYSAQNDPRLGPSLGRDTQDLGFLWAETPKSWFFSVNWNLRDRLWSVLLAALYLTWSDSESGLGPCLIFFWIRPDGLWGFGTGCKPRSLQKRSYEAAKLNS